MAERKINIAEFQVDVEALTQAAAETLKAINQIKEEQKQLVKEGKQTDQAFIRNAVNLRGLQKEYNAELAVLDKHMKAQKQQVPLQQQIDIALRREAVTINDLREQNKELTAIRNQVNLTTEEGERQLIELNKQLDINNGLIKNNVSELEQQKIGIGSYADSIREALADAGMFNGTLGEIQSTLSKFSPMFDTLKKDVAQTLQGFTNLTAGTEGLTKAQKASVVANNLAVTSLKTLRLALIGTGIGAIVVLLGSFIAYLQSSEAASNRLGKILGVLGGIVQKLMDYLEPLGELVMDGLVKGFELLGKAATRTLEMLAVGLDALGFTKAARGVLEFSNSMEEAAKNAGILTEMQQKYTEAQRMAGIVQLQYQRDAEKFRQIRDDENRTIQERIRANEQLGEVLAEQLQKEQAIANQALAIANLRIAQEGRTAAALDAQAEAMERVIDIQERITGQESEQLTNRVSLQKEAADKAKEANQQRIDQMNQELALYEAQNALVNRTMQQELEYEEELSNRRRKILDAELKYKMLSQTEYQTALIELENGLAERRSEIANDALQRELDSVEDRIAIEQAVSEAVGLAKIKFEEDQFKKLQEARLNMINAQFEQDLINEQEYADAIAEVRQQQLLKEADFRKERADLEKEARKEQLELDREARMLSLEEIYASEWEIRELQIQQDRERRLEEARLRYTDSALLAQAELNIEREAALASQTIEREKNRAIWQSRADLAGALSQIFGEETTLGKAAGIAQATINTYVGMTEALKLPWPLNLAAAASTLATGLGAVRSITSTDASVGDIAIPEYSANSAAQQTEIALSAVPPFAKGGRVRKSDGIAIKRSNGDNILATLRTDEAVLNKEQQQRLGGDAVLAAVGVPGFADGGLVGSRNTTLQNALFQSIDDTLAEKIGDAVRDGSRQGTETGSRQGILDLSTEQYLRSLSSF